MCILENRHKERVCFLISAAPSRQNSGQEVPPPPGSSMLCCNNAVKFSDILITFTATAFLISQLVEAAISSTL